MKSVLLKVAAAAAGITLALCIVAGSVLWYMMRPKPLKPWDDKALISTGPPGFGPSTTGDFKFSFVYTVKNNTEDDYSTSVPSELRTELKLDDGSLSSPLDSELITVGTPIFIPAHQVGSLELLTKAAPPAQRQGETDDDYHERLRQFLNEKLSKVQQFVLFDQTRRYQIILPRWAATKPPVADRKP